MTEVRARSTDLAGRVAGRGPAESRWVGSVDGLRAMAALGIVAMHMQAESSASLATSRITAALVIPVFALFFVISGFVLYRPWANRHLAARPGRRPIIAPDGGIVTFWLRRAFRIYPVYWTVLTFSILTNGRTGELHGIGDWIQLLTLFPLPDRSIVFDQGIGLIVWTLIVDLAFYLVLPLWGRAISKLIERGSSPLATELLPAVGLAIVLAFLAVITHLMVLGIVALLVMGMILAVAAAWQSVQRRPVAAIAWLAARPWVSGLVVLACWAAGSSVVSADISDPLFSRRIWLHLGAMIFVSIALFVPAVFGSGAGAYQRAMVSRVARLLGPLTYGLYLWHYPMERVVHRAVGTSFLALMITVLPMSVAAAFVTNRLVQAPIDRLRHRMFGWTLATRRGGGRGAAAAPRRAANDRSAPSGTALQPDRRPVRSAVSEGGTAGRVGVAKPALAANSWAAPITGFRAIAAIVVVVGHTFLSARTFPFTGVIHVAGLVVPSFFVISAYALYRPFVVDHVRRVRPRQARSFWWRRLLRIYPLYAVALTAYLVLLPGVRPNGGGALAYLKLYAFMQVYDQHLVAFSGIPAAWFLCDEVAFYLAIPIIAWLARAWAVRNGARTAAARMRPHLLIALSFVVVGPFVRAALVLNDVPGATSLPISNLDFYGLGMIIGILSLREHLDLPIPRPVDWLRRRPPIAFGITFLALFTLAVVADKPDVLFERREVVLRYALWTVAVLPLMVVLLLGDQTRGVNLFLSGRRFFWLGALSLHIYLWHQLLLGSFSRYLSELASVRYGPRFTTITVIEIAIVSTTVALSAALRPLLDAPYGWWSDRFDGPRGRSGVVAPRRATARGLAASPRRRLANS